MPIYHRVAMDIEHRIAFGEWGIGERLPSELELSEQYGISRTTMRQALTILEQQRLIVRRRPSGTFVTDLPEKLAPSLSIPVAFVKSLLTSGHTTTYEMARVSIEALADHRIARHLNVETESSVTRFDRRLRVDGSLVASVHSLVPQSLCPGFESIPLIRDSIHATMAEHFAIQVTDADHWIEGRLADQDLASELGIAAADPVLILTSLYLDAELRPVEFVTTYWRADVMKLHIHSHITPDVRIVPDQRFE